MISVGVPCSQLPPVELDIINTSEAEALAMAAGISLAGKEVRIYAQDDGFLNTINVATTLIIPYQIDDIMWKIFWRTDCVHHQFANKLAVGLWLSLMKRCSRI